MSNLQQRDWQSIYESQPSHSGAYLVDEFYVPALQRSTQYDRIAGYFSSSALAVASRGVDALVENGGEMRLIVGAELYETDRPVLEALTDELEGSLEDLDDERLDANLQLLAHYLREGNLHIKVAVPRKESWGIFHPKLGIFHDEDDNALSFEGSVNETIGGWGRNYERFKVHRSWVDEQAEYVNGDIDTFDRLWSDDHAYVEVHDLPKAIENKLIDWKAPDTDADVQETIEIARGNAPSTDRDKANIIADGHLSPGGLALAEQASTITPWPHQRVVSDTLVNTYPNSFLLCDEVGLGKTIEAGLTLSRLGLTEELQTGLLLVPASLTIQWQEELWEKFNLNAYRFDRGSDYEYAFIDAFGRERSPPDRSELTLDNENLKQSWVESPIWRFLHAQQVDEEVDGPTIVIMSWHTARLTDRWDQIAPEDNGAVRTREDVPASCRGRPPEHREGVWDAVIVDEAHNARKGSNFYTLLERLREHTQTYYLLTATPMQLHAGELYDIMSLLDLPGRWDDKDAFVKFFETRQALRGAIDDGLGGSKDVSSDESWSAQTTLNDQYQGRLPAEQQLSDQVFRAVADQLDLNEGENNRAIAKERLLSACNLASDYGEYYDGYVEVLEDAMDRHEIDPFDAKEDEKLKYLLYPEWKADEEWLMYSRGDQLDALDELSEGGWRVVQDLLGESSPVDALIHRNTRDTLRKYEQVGLLDETVPTRDPDQREIELTDDTRRVYDRIDEYTRKFYKLAQQSSEADTRAIGFVMTTYRQRLTSSVYAISQSLQTRLETLRAQKAMMEGKKRAAEAKYSSSEQTVVETLSEYDLEDFEALEQLEGDLEDADIAEIAPSVTDEGLDLLEQEIDELESFVSDLKTIDRDPKIDQLIADLDTLDRDGHNRIIVFTQYTDTMDFIRDSLLSIHAETVATYSGRGGEMYDGDSEEWRTVSKERVKREFADEDSSVEILVCTDSASEGLNLQECGALINYDLPWNPMRVEQRIGRIDRIGQQHPEVTILNYSYKDTVETDIYDRLDSRIDLFENVVGDMQPILSGVSQQIRSATLETDRTESNEAIEEADREFSEQIEEQSQQDRVEVGESLDTLETFTQQDVIDEAKLEAWTSYNHPDIVEPGDSTYEYTLPFERTGAESFLVGNQTLSENEIRFTPVSELEIDTINDSDTVAFEERTYRLELRNDIPAPSLAEEQTVAAEIASGENEIAVTFSAACADEYPSLHYLAPGNPVLGALVETIRESTDDTERLSNEAASRELFGGYPLLCAWGRNGRLATLDEQGNVQEKQELALLSKWCEQFLDNREQSTSLTAIDRG